MPNDSTVVGDIIQWVTNDSTDSNYPNTGNYSEGSAIEKLVGLGTQASAYKNQVKQTAASAVDIFTASTGDSMSYLKVLFTGPIVVPDANLTLATFTEISGPSIGGTLTNSKITSVAGKTTTKASVVLKIANKGTSSLPTFSVTPGTTRFVLTSATMKVTDAYGNAVFPAAGGSGPLVNTTDQNETDD